MRKVHLYLLLVLAFGGVLFSVNDSFATFASPVPLPVPAEELATSCTIPYVGSVVAGVSGQPFPRIVDCPTDGALCTSTPALAPGTYARWDYAFTFTGYPSQAGTQVAADVAIAGANPAAMITVLGKIAVPFLVGGNDFDSKWILFNPTGAGPFSATYFTKSNVVARIEGAGERAGFNLGFCKLAGAGYTSDASAGGNVVTSVSGQVGSCPFSRSTDTKQCTRTITLTGGGSCTTTEIAAPLFDGKPVSPNTKCDGQSTSVDGSCTVCFPSTGGKFKCITDPTVASCPR